MRNFQGTNRFLRGGFDPQIIANEFIKLVEIYVDERLK